MRYHSSMERKPSIYEPRANPASIWRAMRLLTLGLFLFITCGPAVMAENTTNSSTFFLQDRKLPPVQRLRPQPSTLSRFAPNIARRSYASPVWNRPQRIARPAPVPDKPVVPTIPPSFFPAVIGDSLAVLLAQGLQEAYADKPEVGILRKGRESSGLVRDDFYDWPKAVDALLAGSEHIDVAVMIIGSNDRQEMPDKTGAIVFRTADNAAISNDWLAAYGNRVEAIANKFKQKNIPLIWVGMPVMKSERMSADLIQLNEIYRSRATKAGAVYVDVWEAFTNDSGKFDAFGPNVNGEVVKLRTSDGVHFTKAGALKLAHFVEGDIKRVLDLAKPAADPVLAALPAPANAQDAPAKVQVLPDATGQPTTVPAPEADINAGQNRQVDGSAAPADPASSSPALVASLPLPAEPPPLFLPLRPAAGPVFLLTAPPLAPTGELLGLHAQKPAAGDAQAMIDQTFVEGRTARARPGRADSFVWPQP